jgi:hypothetical protein
VLIQDLNLALFSARDLLDIGQELVIDLCGERCPAGITMRHLLRAVAVGIAFTAASIPLHANAQTPTAIQLRGDLTQADAAKIIAVVKAAQAKLRGGESLYFELLSGAPASYEQTKIAPRDVFLALSFEDPFSIEYRSTGNRLWQPYRFEIRGERALVWQVDVVLGINGNLERIEILARPPHPF